MKNNLTQGSVSKGIIKFSLPLIIGNIFQQIYNMSDTIIVGRFIGADALAAVGSSFTLITFLTSVIIGLCMGASVVFSRYIGAKEEEKFADAVYSSFIFIATISVILNILVFLFINNIMDFLNIPEDIRHYTREYLMIIFSGIIPVFFYNFTSAIIRSTGNSTAPLVFLVVPALVNIVLDFVFVVPLNMGVAGAAYSTLMSEVFSAILTTGYCIKKMPLLRNKIKSYKPSKKSFKNVISNSVLASVQQSIMNLGILLVQGLVNSFGVATMAAYAAATKIEAFAYIPLQQYGDAFSTFVAQNFGAKKTQRIKKGVKYSTFIILGFGAVLSLLVTFFAPNLLQLFVSSTETEILAIGTNYLKITGSFYILIGFLFSFYGYFRGIGKSSISVVLTVVSLGLRVVLAYLAAPMFGASGMWWCIPLGWFIADIVGLIFLRRSNISEQ